MRRHTTTRPLPVATYIRISAEPTDERSMQAQADRVRAHAESLGWQPVAVFEPDLAQEPVAP